MPKPRYFYNKRYRVKHPEQRKIDRQKNYALTGGAEKNWNHEQLWTTWEINFLKRVKHNDLYTDREIHKVLGRSVQAIQNMRHKLKKEM